MEIFSLIVQVLISFCIIGEIAGVILAIIFLILAIGENDVMKKKKKYYIALVSFIAPIIVLLALLSIWGLVWVIKQ